MYRNNMEDNGFEPLILLVYRVYTARALPFRANLPSVRYLSVRTPLFNQYLKLGIGCSLNRFF